MTIGAVGHHYNRSMGQIYDITTFSLLDYPDELSCIVWMSGCNLRCVYCHNPEIVLNKGTKDAVEVVDFLKKRRGRLTAVVFSGGEATFCSDFPELVRQAHGLGFKTKLDTNGSNPDVVRALVEEGILNYVALDYKCPGYLAERILGTAKFDEAFRHTLVSLIRAANEGKVRLEVRTTVSPAILNETDLNAMIADLDALGYRDTYWLQNIVTAGEKTLGNVPETNEVIDRTKLTQPKNFTMGYRNFPEDQ
ncbi:MAG: anaerobic ribonucleoside-triphosphate reductase activating protein [Alphaproteobacteria bacterium]|nr:anaerobic ribonucleoside-triphosphate reductase activating protein [Alphaproteobacteria bacterium]